MRKRTEFNRELLTINVLDERGDPYEVDLEECTSSAEMLDWILQIAGKRWCTPRILAEFIETIEDACYEVFGREAQGVFCPGGVDQQVDWKKGRGPARRGGRTGHKGTA